MTKRELRFLILLFAIVIGFMSYMLVFKKQFIKIDELEVQITDEEAQISSYNRAGAQIKNLNDSIEDIEIILESIYNVFLGDFRQEEIILLINEILVRSEVSVPSLSFTDFSKGSTQMIDYETFDVSIPIDGSYKEVMDFVSSFWRFDHNIYISNLNLSLGGDDEDETEEKQLSGLVNVAFLKVNNEYASDVKLFEWYSDILYQKENPFEDTDFSALFLPNYFYTGSDVAFYNKRYEPFNDIIGHWGEKILNLFGRSGYLIGDDGNNIYPDSLMTRLETVLLLDLVFRWEIEGEIANLENFADYELISDLDDLSKKSLIKAYSSGYLYGYDDNTLRPQNNISYEELGFIGTHLLDDDNITWQLVARDLEELTGYRSVGLDDINGNATTAEIVYFLAYIDDKQDD